MAKNGDPIWSVPGYTVRQTPFTATVHDARNGKRYRGGQCVSVTADTIGLKFHAEPNILQTASVARALKPIIRKGDPVIVELSGASGYTVAALHDGQFASNLDNQEASVDRDEFTASRITEAFWNL